MKKKLLLLSTFLALNLTLGGSIVLAKDTISPDISNAITRTTETEENTGIYIESQSGGDSTELLTNDSEQNERPAGYSEISQSDNTVQAQSGEEARNDTSSVQSRAASPASDFTYKKLSSKSIEITKYKGNSNAVSIPQKINGIPVTKIGTQAFIYSELQSVTIPEGVTEIGEAAFYACYNLETVKLPKSLRKIDNGTFVYCYGLQTITLNEGLQSIGDYAFQNTSIKKLTLPSTLKTIGQLIFYDCNFFSEYAENNNPYFSIADGVLFTNDKKTLLSYPTRKTTASYTVPGTVTTIKESAFQGAVNLQKITIGSKVKTIESWAFSQSYLQAFTLPATVTKIGDGIVSECSNLKKLTIKNNNIKSLGYRLASNCTSLETVYLSGKFTEISGLAFAYCDNLVNVTLPSGLKEILNGAFGECRSLESIKLPSGLETIAYQAFFNDIKLKTINIPSSVKAIYSQAFYNCPVRTQIKNLVKLPNVSEDVYLAAQTLKVTGQANYTNAYQVLSLVNAQRKKAGLKSLTMDQELLDAAMQRAAELSLYFDHYRPYGGLCFDISSKMQSENIACYQTSPAGAMDSWMNSDGHRANILSENNTSIGIGCFYQNGAYYWVQCFGSGSIKNAVKKSNTNKTFTIYAIEEYVTPYFEYSSNSLKQNAQQRFVPYVQGTRIEPSSFNWKSNNPLVASISNTGLMKALAGGSTTITITNKTLSSAKTTLKFSVIAPKYTVKFNANGGKVSTTSKKVYKGNKYGTLPAPSRKGYSFDGWYTSKNNGSKVTDNTKVSKENHTLYAHWKKTKYTVKYVLNGGTNNSKNPSAYYITSSTVTLKNPTRKGYTFQGWYTSSSYKTKVTKLAKGSTGNKTYHAKWSVNTYTIRYNKNGGTSGSMADTKSCKYGSAYTLRANAFKKTGYKFAGWATSASGTVVYKDKASVKSLTSTNKAIKTLYAKWTPYTYTLSYHLNGGKNHSSNPKNYKYTSNTITLKSPSKTGYTFNGWYTDSGYKNKLTKIPKGSTGSKSLYAKWTANTYTIHYNKNGATSGSMADTKSCKYGSTYTLRANTFKKTGYIFAGWSTSTSGKVSYKDKESVKKLTSTNNAVKTLYAKWTPVNYIIHYDANGGTGDSMTDKTSCQYDAEYVLDENTYTYEGYEFTGWNTRSDGTGTSYTALDKVKNLTAVPDETIILYAQWTPAAITISLEVTSLEMMPGETRQLTPVIAPVKQQNTGIEYSSDRTDVASIDSNGVVKALSAGEAEITCKTSNTSDIPASVKVIVVDPVKDEIDKPDSEASDKEELITKPDPEKTVNEETTNKSAFEAPVEEGPVTKPATENDVITISTAEELANISLNLSASYVLKEDIDLSGYEWIPIGNEEEPFTGTFDGNNHTISGLTITDSSNTYNGLFGYLNGTVQDLTLEGLIDLKPDTIDTPMYIGSIAGYADQAVIANCACHVSITLDSPDDEQNTLLRVDGIVGDYSDNAVISDSVNDSILTLNTSLDS